MIWSYVKVETTKLGSKTVKALLSNSTFQFSMIKSPLIYPEYLDTNTKLLLPIILS